MITLSPAARALLDVVQFRCGVSFDLIDATLSAVHPPLTSEFPETIAEPGVRERCLAALRSGESRVERDLSIPLALNPLRRDREIVGLIITRRSRTASAALANDDVYRQLEAAGQIAATAAEIDLVTGAQLGQAWDRTRRLQGILRFIGQLAASDGERALMQAIVQAASVWFDLDCRIYNREPDGSYVLFAALPGIDRSEIKARLDGAALRNLATVRRLSSAADLEAVGWTGRRGEVLVFGVGREPEWIFLLTGVFEPDVELTFAALAHVMDGTLQQVAHHRVRHWQDRLTAHAIDANLAPERALVRMLEELASAVRVAGARVSVENAGAQRTLAALNASGDAASRLLGGDEAASHVRLFRIGPQAQMRLELWGREEPFGFQPLALVDAWIAAVQPWLSGTTLGSGRTNAIDDRIDELAFERRVQDEVERAKRFNLGLSLVVIDPNDVAEDGESPVETVVNAVRPELRASDLLGRVRGGAIAVLLVHAGPEGARSVASRLGHRLAGLVDQTHRAAARLGQAVFSSECQSGDALIRQALQRIEELKAGG
jgi:hypothetical protein